MIRIAVCDDDADMVKNHSAILEEALKEHGCTGDITTYTSSENLIYDIREDGFFYDLILLDIEMPQITGMEAAKIIRETLRDIKIIFITSHVEYAIDAFELSVFRYIPKNQIGERLPAALKDVLSLIRLEEDKCYTIQVKGRFERILYKDIIYITRDGKNSVINTAEGESRIRKSLKEVFDELGSDDFIFIDRGCIVNIIHVMQIKNSTALMKNGSSLPVSRSNLQAVKERINEYWGSVI